MVQAVEMLAGIMQNQNRTSPPALTGTGSRLALPRARRIQHPVRGLLVPADFLFQVFQLLTRKQADAFKRRKVFLGFCQVPHQQISLSDVLVRAAVT